MIRIGLRDLPGNPPWFFKMRLVKGGPWVRAIIVESVTPDRPAKLLGYINDEEARLSRIVERGRQIERDAYEAIPIHADPRSPITLAEMEPLF